MKKRVIATVLTCILCVSLIAGCSNAAEGPTSTAAGTAPGQSAETPGTASQGNDAKEEIALTIASIIGKDIAPNHEPVTRLLKEKFNIKAEWTDISTDEQLNLLFSTGQYPDLIWNYNGEGTIKRWATQGYLYSIDEYMDHLPNYRALFSDEEWNTTHTYASNADGKLYYVPTKNYRSAAEAWMYRMNILKELDKEIPATADELYDLLKAYKEKYPDSIPIANRWGFSNFLKGFALAFRTGTSFLYDPDSSQLEYGPATDKFREMLIYVSKLYAEGLVDPELQTATDTQWEEVYANGLNVLEYSYTNRPVWANNVMKDADPDADWQWTSQYVTAYPEKGELVPKELPYQPWGSVLTKAMTEEELQRFLEVIDWSCSEEGQRWFSMGEEVITYEMADGKPVFKDDIYSVTNPDGKEIAELGYGYYLIRSRESLEQTGYADDLALSKEVEGKPYRAFVSYALTEDQEKELIDPETQIDDIYQEYTLRFITGSLDPSSDETWQEYLDRLKSAGLQEVAEIRESVAIISQ